MLVPFSIAPIGDAETLRAVGALLDALTTIDLDQVSRLPPVMESGVRYHFRPGKDACGISLDHWRDARTTFAQREGDCEDLASWLAASLIVAGQPARAVPFAATPTLIHVVVWSGGRILDPSRALGMPMPPGVSVSDFRARVMRALSILDR